MRNHKFLYFISCVALCFLQGAVAKAQQTSHKQKWSVDAGSQLVQISSDGIHINQPNPKGLTYYGIVSTHINLPAGKPWKIAFDLKFGQLRSAGTAIGLFAGPHLLGWVGADGWYKRMGCFVGKSNEVAAPSANMDWHKVQFSSDGATIIVTEDGNVIGSGVQSGTPDTIKIGDINGSAQPSGAQPTKMLEGQQSELWVRNVQVADATGNPKNDEVVPHLLQELARLRDENSKLRSQEAQSPVSNPVPNSAAKQENLESLVSDYNVLLQRADQSQDQYDANYIAEEDAGRKGQFDLQRAIMSSDIPLTNEELDSLRKATNLRRLIIADPRFAMIYRETTFARCLTKMSAKGVDKDLRYIQKR